MGRIRAAAATFAMAFVISAPKTPTPIKSISQPPPWIKGKKRFAK
jgi:hypothetical protein